MVAAYHAPADLVAALSLLAENCEKAIVIAGGTELTRRLRDNPASYKFLIDIGRLHDLRGVQEGPAERLQVGALTTCADLASSAILAARAPILAEAARHVGGPQIRNLATVGGNIASRSACADLVPSLLVLDAAVTLQSETGTRRLPLEDYLAGDGRPDELITMVDCECADEGTAFVRIAARRALAPAIASVAVLLRRAGPEWTQVRVALGGVAQTAMRARRAEEALSGRLSDLASAAGAAAEAASNETAPESDSWASAWYRTHVVAVLVRRALFEAQKRLVNA